MDFDISPEGVFIDINDAPLKLLDFERKEEALENNVRDFYIDIGDLNEIIKEI